MKGKEFKELLRKKSVRFGGVALAALVAVGSLWASHSQSMVPELVTFVDTEGSIQIAEDEVPLAAPKVTKSTKTKKKTKKVKMRKASKKTYKKKGKTKTKKKTKKSKSRNTTTKTVTVVSSHGLDK